MTFPSRLLRGRARNARLTLFVILAVVPGSAAKAQFRPVSLGIDVLEQRSFDILRGQTVGLVTNQTGRDSRGHSTIDVLRSAPGVRLMALFAPEHGIRGNIGAGKAVKSSHDAVTGLPIYSLNGANYRPTDAMLSGLQTLVFDMQDVGARSYTFIATMEECRRACSAAGCRLVILDRPNPVGAAMEGNIPTSTSRLCPFPIPYRYGLTVGELALWLNARSRQRANLTVVPLQNFERQPFEQTGLTWVPSSPNIPRPTSPFFYSATGLLGELPALSIGIGTPWPFELAGAPDINGAVLAARLNARKLPGWRFDAVSWTPTQGSHAGRLCQGVWIRLLDPKTAQLTRLNFEIFAAVRKLSPSIAFFSSQRHNLTFDAVCGTSQIRRLLQQGQSSAAIWNYWNQGVVAFRTSSAKFRLYGELTSPGVAATLPVPLRTTDQSPQRNHH